MPRTSGLILVLESRMAVIGKSQEFGLHYYTACSHYRTPKVGTQLGYPINEHRASSMLPGHAPMNSFVSISIDK
jgi:hypothetical protein